MFFVRVKRVTIELGDITQHNLKQLKVLNRDVFPVAYNEKFYKDLLGAGELCKLGKVPLLIEGSRRLQARHDPLLFCSVLTIVFVERLRVVTCDEK